MTWVGEERGRVEDDMEEREKEKGEKITRTRSERGSERGI